MPKPTPQKNWIEPERWLARRRWRRWILYAVGLLLLLLLMVADQHGWLLYHGDEWSRYHNKTFLVTHVEEGDKLEIQATDGSSVQTRVRLWGVESPLSAKPKRGLGAQPLADEAVNFTKKIVLNQKVRIELQPHLLRDQHGVILAYVFPEQGVMLNMQLLQAGLAMEDSQMSHDHAQEFHAIQLQAREQKIGIWAMPSKMRKVALPLTMPAATQRQLD